MRPIRLLVAVLLLLLGLVWIGQGIGLIGGSFMTSQPIWALVGAGLVVVAAGVGWSAKGRGRGRPPLTG